MKGCIIDPYFSILLNCTSKGFLKASRGLCQGDPLFLFLFSLVADGLSAIFRKVEEARLLDGFVIGDDSIMVSHLLFADDTTLFLKADVENIRSIKLCMLIFQVISGLKVNLFKTSMVGIEVEGNSLLRFVEMMGCSVGRWPIKYLGMQLGGNPKLVALWDPVVEKVSSEVSVLEKVLHFFRGPYHSN